MIKKSIKRYDDEDFAKRLRTLMGNRDIKLKDLAEATGNALSTVSTWKRGRLPRNDESLNKLADALNVSPKYLLDGDKNDAVIFSNENEDSIMGYASPKVMEITSYVESLVDAAKKTDYGLEHLLYELKNKIPLKTYTSRKIS